MRRAWHAFLILVGCSAQCIKNSCESSQSTTPTSAPTSIQEFECLGARTAPLLNNSMWDEPNFGHARSLKCAHQIVGTGDYERSKAYLWCMINHTVHCDHDEMSCPCHDAGPTFEEWGADRCLSEVYELLGFSHRKQIDPDFEKSRDYYDKALDLAPHSCEARSYYAELAATVEDQANASQALDIACSLCGASHDFVQPPIALYAERFVEVDELPCSCVPGCHPNNETVILELLVAPPNASICASDALVDTVPALEHRTVESAVLLEEGAVSVLVAASSVPTVDIFVDALREGTKNVVATEELQRAIGNRCNTSTPTVELLAVELVIPEDVAQDMKVEDDSSTALSAAVSLALACAGTLFLTSRHFL